MEITDIRIKKNNNGNKILAYASVTFDKELVVRNISIVEGRNGLFIGMPSKKVNNEYYDIAFAITSDFRDKMSSEIIAAYDKIIAN